MRTLTAALTTAQKSLSSRPAVLVKLRGRIGPALQLLWSSLYAGSEADSYHAAVCPADNSLVRARVEGNTLYRQRVASPGAGSDYSVWSSFTDILITGKGIALAATGVNVSLFYTADNGGVVTLYCRDSTDSGATWGSPVQVATGIASSFEHVSACYVNSAYLICFYTTGASSENVYRIKRLAGAWGAAAVWSNTVSAVTGLSVCYVSLADVQVLLTGKDASNNYLVLGCVYGLGVNQADDTWSALNEIRKSHSGTSVSYKYPSIGYFDVLRESFVEIYTGTDSYTRTMGLYSRDALSFQSNLHRDDYRLPVLSGTYGYAIAYNATKVFLSTSKALYWADDVVTIVDVSADVLSAKQRIRPFGGELDILLNNAHGLYTSTSFILGSEVDFQPGYYSTAGAEYSSGQTYYIESLVQETSGSKSSVFLMRCVDAWGVLAKAQARSYGQFNMAAPVMNIKQIVEYFLNLAGISLTVSSNSTPFTGEYPKVSLYYGEYYVSFVKRLYGFLTDLIYVRGANAISFNPSSGDASVYSYGGSNHPVFSGLYSSNVLAFNRIQVQGSGVYSDEFVQTEIDRVYGRYEAYADVNADTSGKAGVRAAAFSAKEQYKSQGGVIRIPVNCGQELYDVIDITDAGAGLSAAKRRVFGIDLVYDTLKSKYQMELLLGAV